MFVKIYGPLLYRLYCKLVASRQRVLPENIVHVSRGIIVNAHDNGFGVFDSTGKFVKASRQMRGNRSQFIPTHIPSDVRYVDLDVVFFGNVFPHFGHFLLEHMNRAWALMQNNFHDMPIVLANHQNIHPVPQYIYDLLEILGVHRDKIIILDKATQFRNVYIPTQAFNIPVGYADVFAAPFEYMANTTRGEKYDKIYVSRAKLSHGRTYGEECIQKIFADNGFHIIYPENMPLAQQISFMKNCRVLAGCAGTALHMALFMPAGGTVIQIKRNRENKDNFDVQNMICKVKRLNSVYIAGSIEPIRTQHSTEMPQIIGMTKYMRKFFDENRFLYTQSGCPGKDAWNLYNSALAAFRATSGSPFIYRAKWFLIKIMACTIPGRARRGRFRKRMQARLMHR